MAPHERRPVHAARAGLGKRASNGKMLALPDCPEVYFLSGRRNPSLFIYEFSLLYKLTSPRLLRLLNARDIAVVVINTVFRIFRLYSMPACYVIWPLVIRTVHRRDVSSSGGDSERTSRHHGERCGLPPLAGAFRANKKLRARSPSQRSRRVRRVLDVALRSRHQHASLRVLPYYLGVAHQRKYVAYARRVRTGRRLRRRDLLRCPATRRAASTSFSATASSITSTRPASSAHPRIILATSSHGTATSTPRSRAPGSPVDRALARQLDRGDLAPPARCVARVCSNDASNPLLFEPYPLIGVRCHSCGTWSISKEGRGDAGRRPRVSVGDPRLQRGGRAPRSCSAASRAVLDATPGRAPRDRPRRRRQHGPHARDRRRGAAPTRASSVVRALAQLRPPGGAHRRARPRDRRRRRRHGRRPAGSARGDPALPRGASAGYDVVYALRVERKEGWHLRAGYFLFYRLMAAAARAFACRSTPATSGCCRGASSMLLRAASRAPPLYLRGLRIRGSVSARSASRYRAGSRALSRRIEIQLCGSFSCARVRRPLRFRPSCRCDLAAPLGALTIAASLSSPLYSVLYVQARPPPVTTRASPLSYPGHHLPVRRPALLPRRHRRVRRARLPRGEGQAGLHRRRGASGVPEWRPASNHPQRFAAFCRTTLRVMDSAYSKIYRDLHEQH